MDQQPNALVLELLAWISSRRRSYGETMEAWRTNCPRHSVWEDALNAGLVRLEGEPQQVILTSLGEALLNGKSPSPQ